MSCPICGANCRCKKRGPGGICCSCHKHKVRKLILTPLSDDPPELLRSIEQHQEWMRLTKEKENKKFPLLEGAI